MAKQSKLTTFFEKYRGVRRLILAILTTLIIYLTLIMIHMYIKTGTVDPDYAQVLIAYLSVYGVVVSFYTHGRSRSDVAGIGTNVTFGNNVTEILNALGKLTTRNEHIKDGGETPPENDI